VHVLDCHVLDLVGVGLEHVLRVPALLRGAALELERPLREVGKSCFGVVEQASDGLGRSDGGGREVKSSEEDGSDESELGWGKGGREI